MTELIVELAFCFFVDGSARLVGGFFKIAQNFFKVVAKTNKERGLEQLIAKTWAKKTFQWQTFSRHDEWRAV